MSDAYRGSIHGDFDLVMKQHGVFDAIDVVYVHSQSKVPEYVVKDDAAYVIYDQYGGQFLNMCNRLLLYQPSAKASIAYFHKIVAEEARRYRRADMYIFMLAHYISERHSIPKPERLHHLHYTRYQEEFCLFHEAFHAAQAVRPAVLAHINAEASARLDKWRRTAGQIDLTRQDIAENLAFQDRFFDENVIENFAHAGLGPNAAIAEHVTTESLSDLNSEAAADIFAFYAVVGDAAQRVKPEERPSVVRDAICACYAGFLHLRTLYQVRAMIETGERDLTEDLLRSSPLLWSYVARSFVMHSLALEALQERVPRELLEYDYPAGLAELTLHRLGVPEATLTLMTIQKFEYAAVLDPFMAVTKVALSEHDADSYVAAMLARVSDRDEKGLITLGDEIWRELNTR